MIAFMLVGIANLAAPRQADPWPQIWTELEALRAIVVDQSREQLAVGTDFERAEPEIFLSFGLDRLVEDHLVLAAAHRLAVPGPILRSRLERPPVEEVAVA